MKIDFGNLSKFSSNIFSLLSWFYVNNFFFEFTTSSHFLLTIFQLFTIFLDRSGIRTLLLFLLLYLFIIHFYLMMSTTFSFYLFFIFTTLSQLFSSITHPFFILINYCMSLMTNAHRHSPYSM